MVCSDHAALVLQNLNHMMVAMAQLLHIRMPGSYEVTFPSSPGTPGATGPGNAPEQPGTQSSRTHSPP